MNGIQVEHYEELLVALRRVSRATDLHSRQLIKTFGLTAPQLLILRSIRNEYAATASNLARNISLSQATVTNILDRLEKRGLIRRYRSTEDKRKVNVLLTEKGVELLKRAPGPFQESFIEKFRKLPEWEQLMILSSVQKIAAMMDTEGREGPETPTVLDIDELDHRIAANSPELEESTK